MTVFSRDQEKQNRLDFELLQFGPVSLYHDTDLLGRDIATIEALEYVVCRLDLKSADIDSFHSLVAASLRFPDYYGRNLNAFNDCIGELPYTFTSDLLLVLDAFDTFFHRQPQFAHGVLDNLWSQAYQNQLVGHTMLILIQSSDPRLQLPPVGNGSVYWNPAEFLNRDRGV